ncbi:hypothetical protein LCGC14_1546610 [marine sediment metagenome]|uniref:Uncharacterized protein n=1 Tax=marine sediment metagenome TaxID=412755 RepID=A0A0F9LSB9_9ZZZZ
MATTIDLSRKTGLLTLGTHTFRVLDKSVEELGPSGDPYWRLICEVISKGEDQGKEIMHSISLGHKSRFIMDEFLDGVDAPRSGKGDLGQFLGKTFRASVGQDTYNGKLKSVITNIMPVSADQPSWIYLLRLQRKMRLYLLMLLKRQKRQQKNLLADLDRP